jgi:Mg2+ and Co2+ transporter CorA
MDEPVDRVGERAGPCVRALLFDAQGKDREVPDLQAGDVAALAEHELAWIDIRAQDHRDVERVFDQLALQVPDIASLFEQDAEPLSVREDWFAARAIAPCWNDAEADLDRVPWLLVVGPNVVVTAHKKPIGFLDTFKEHHDPGSSVGALDGDSFAVVLLDRMLTAWFDAMDAFECKLDTLEVDILENRAHTGHLPYLRTLRRAAAAFRRLLSQHRDLFDALRRPDFRPERDDHVDKRFRAVADRYERAMDAAENARQLVVGSYELLETRLSQRTNETMRLLTFVTVLLGGLAVVAGVLGMNFQAKIFDTGSAGFWTTVAAMASVAIGALLLARWRGWWR